MSKNNGMKDLRDTLFETIEKLKSGEIKVAEAHAINSIATTLVNSAKVEVDYMKIANGQKDKNGFIQLEAEKE